AVSFNQQRLLLVSQLQGSLLQGNNALYNMPITLELKGLLNVAAVLLAFEQIIERHEILRTRYQFTGGLGVQHVEPLAAFVLGRHDLSGKGEQQAALTKIIEAGSQQCFDLEQGMMIRADLITLADEHQVLLVVIHHIAFDGWSNAILVDELRSFYQSNLTKQPSSLVPMTIQYADYALWQQQNWLETDGSTGQYRLSQYWLNQLHDLPPVHSIPLDGQRSGENVPVYQSLELNVDAQAFATVNAVAAQHKVSTFVVMYAAFSYLLSGWSQSKDIVVGTPVAGRDAPELESLLGFFINTVVLRNKVDKTASFADLLEQSKHTTSEAFAHQSMPFELLVEQLNPERSTHYNPLFQI
ncbi:MAG: condensation domain-containing protein, partial [Psychrosphaera sp.]|nr:condensation domain-containing protein [Psychrosphaera sp.]